MFARGDGAQQATLDMAERMLSYIAAYLLFDGMYIVYASAIKGAGDTKFAMWTGVLMAWVFMALPSIAAYWLGYSIWFIWSFMVGYVVLAGIVFYLRYRGGKWTKMRVIES
jgi:MATE family multidrug resistance protein